MIPILLSVCVLLLWAAKQIFGSLIGQQARGSVPDYTHRLVKRAAEMLPNELAASYEEDWLAELKALENKPLSAIRYARGLSRAARSISTVAVGAELPSRLSETLRRMVEFNAGLLFLLSLAPALSVISLAIKLDSRGPVLVSRQRLGKEGEPFRLLSFRTLHVAEHGASGGPHRTRIGELLDRTALDSGPTFVSLLRGQLALVGPPPQHPASEEPPLTVRPGIVSWERLVEMGGSEIGLKEARRRDRHRGFRSDATLIIRQVRFDLRG